MDVCKELRARMWRLPTVQDKLTLNPAYIAIEGANTTRPFAQCSMDLITNLLPVEGYDSILVVVDQGLLKGVILCPCAKTIMWKETAMLLWDNLFKRFGLPDKLSLTETQDLQLTHFKSC
jgi:hypothetical protein